jgi:copper oxidase (laccase) domain-containing protein
MLKAPRSGERWMMIIGPARSEEANNVGRIFIGAFKRPADVEQAAGLHLSDPAAFVVMDISTVAEQVTNALENDGGQTVAA